MTKQEKQLLLVDLCAMLPYDVIVEYGCKHEGKDLGERKSKLTGRMIDSFFGSMTIGMSEVYSLKPYLRPMSSMTEEESEQIIKFICEDSIGINKINITQDYVTAKVDYLVGDSETVTVWFDDIVQSVEMFDFLNACHFDYRGLIPTGLALEATEEMYK